MATDKQQSLSANLEQRPFLGLRSFDEDNKSQFGGRDQEVEELFELIEENALNRKIWQDFRIYRILQRT